MPFIGLFLSRPGPLIYSEVTSGFIECNIAVCDFAEVQCVNTHWASSGRGHDRRTSGRNGRYRQDHPSDQPGRHEAMRGRSVLLADADRQGSSHFWTGAQVNLPLMRVESKAIHGGGAGRETARAHRCNHPVSTSPPWAWSTGV